MNLPHLPRIEAVEAHNGRVYVLEEYIHGDRLDEILACGSLSEQQAGQIIVQLCSALNALHSLGIVHRDIKPENVILRGNDAVLIDFDVSRLIKSTQSKDTQVMGTTGYAAPEQYGFSQTDARADVYALGVLLNEMLTGQHPSKKLAEGRYLPIISRCIEVNVDKRYDSATALLESLVDVNRRKKPRLLIAALILCLILLGGALYILTLPEDNGPPEQFRWEDINFYLHDQGYTTPFWYDLDGDGQTEKYLFGVSFYNTLQDMVLDADVSSVTEEHPVKRAPFPCVWKLSEDEQWIIAEEFADLLEEPETRLSFLSEWENTPPIMDSLEAEWHGGMEIFFSTEHIGSWRYDVPASIDGMDLTAALVTSLFIYDETAPKNDTE